jgi:hypothetical protein
MPSTVKQVFNAHLGICTPSYFIPIILVMEMPSAIQSLNAKGGKSIIKLGQYTQNVK